MTKKTIGSGSVNRRSLLAGFAATALVAAPAFAGAPGFLRGAGEVRRIRMYCGRRGESIDTIYWVEGEYIADAMTEISQLMRDWRNDEVKEIDARAVDVIAAAHALLETDEPYTLVSGYRSPETNAALRRKSNGVAKNSRHLLGQAADLRLRSRSVRQMFDAARSLSAGGVGRYSASGFVHVDCGPIRAWGN